MNACTLCTASEHDEVYDHFMAFLPKNTDQMQEGYKMTTLPLCALHTSTVNIAHHERGASIHKY